MPSRSRLQLPRIPEILKLICDNLADEGKTLARLARTCKDFQEPAFDVLWYEMERFYPLAACLPSHLIKVIENDDDKTLTLSQPLTSIDTCERLFYYSRRIRSYTDYTDEYEYIDKTIYEALQFVTRGTKILPNVQQLTWDCTDESFPFMQMFMGPNLTKVDLMFSPASMAQLSMLSVLHEQHPSLTDIELSFAEGKYSTERRNKAIELISGVVYKWECLQTLDVPYITYASLCEVSKLPQLHTLKMKALTLDGALRKPGSKGGGFPALNDLTLEYCHGSTDCIAVLKLMKCSPLFDLQISFHYGVRSSLSFKDLFQAIAEHCNRTTLEHIEIQDGENLGDHSITILNRNEMIEAEVLKPLFIFRALLFVSVELTQGVRISDPCMIQTMMTSWPKIKLLKIKSRPFTRCPNPDVTLQDIIHIISRYPQLEILALGAFDATSPPKVRGNDTNSIKIVATKLLKLYVDDSPIRKPNSIAATLSGMFPSLRVITTIDDEENALQPRNGDYSPAHTTWKRAESVLKVFAAVRQQERLYAKLQKEDERKKIEEDGKQEEGEEDDEDGMEEL